MSQWNPQLPKCPACDAVLSCLDYEMRDRGAPLQQILFQCGAKARESQIQKWVWITGCPKSMDRFGEGGSET